MCVSFCRPLPSDLHDALFVVGSLDETLELRGLRYHPIDIETSVSRTHRSIAERSVCTAPRPPYRFKSRVSS